MSAEKALSLCLVQDVHHNIAQRSQIDFIQKGLKHFLQLHILSISQNLGYQLHVLTDAQYRTTYILSVLSLLISSECKVSTSIQVSDSHQELLLPPARPAAIQGEGDKISIIFEHLLPE